MPKITEFNKPVIRSMLDDLANHLKDFEAEWGIRIDLRGGRFDLLTFTPKVEITLPNAEGGRSFAKERRAWDLHARFEGLQPGWLDRKFSAHKRTYTIAGFMPRRRSKPVLLLDESTGKRYHAPIDLVQVHMNQLDRTV